MLDFTEEISQDMIGAVIKSVEAQKEGLLCAMTNADNIFTEFDCMTTSINITPNEVKDAQGKDPVIGPVLRAKKNNRRADIDKVKSIGVKSLNHEWNKLVFNDDGILCRKTVLPEEQIRLQIVMPSIFRPVVLKELHDNMGHLGTERVIDLVRSRFYWPRMQSEVEHYITRQCGCIRSRRPAVQHRAPLGLSLIHI